MIFWCGQEGKQRYKYIEYERFLVVIKLFFFFMKGTTWVRSVMLRKSIREGVPEEWHVGNYKEISGLARGLHRQTTWLAILGIQVQIPSSHEKAKRLTSVL